MSKKDRIIHEDTHERSHAGDYAAAAVGACFVGPLALLLADGPNYECEVVTDDGERFIGSGDTPLDAKVDAYKKIPD